MVAEFVVILVGVLVALGVDRWVSERDEADTTRAYLEALRADFEDNLDRAEEKIRVETRLHELALDLLAGLSTEGPRDLDQLVFTTELTGWPYRVPFREGAWNELNTLSGLNLQAVVDLRVAVAEFYATAEFAERLDAQWESDAFEWRDHFAQLLPDETRLEINSWFEDWGSLFEGWDGSVPGG